MNCIRSVELTTLTTFRPNSQLGNNREWPRVVVQWCDTTSLMKRTEYLSVFQSYNLWSFWNGMGLQYLWGIVEKVSARTISDLFHGFCCGSGQFRDGISSIPLGSIGGPKMYPYCYLLSNLKSHLTNIWRSLQVWDSLVSKSQYEMLLRRSRLSISYIRIL